jgi:ribosomal protein L37AE/L43A
MDKGKNKGLTPLQRVCSDLIRQQQKALRKDCPRCSGKLLREQIHILKCSHCEATFYVEDLLVGTAK